MSIAELIIGMVILAIVGLAMTRILSSQARYFDHQKTANLARAVSRGPLNRVVSDLRMVEAKGGVVSASVSAGPVVSFMVSAGGSVVESVFAQPLTTSAVTTSIMAKKLFIFLVSLK